MSQSVKIHLWGWMKVGGKSLAVDQKENPRQVSAFRQVQWVSHAQTGSGGGWDGKFIPKQEGKGQLDRWRKSCPGDKTDSQLFHNFGAHCPLIAAKNTREVSMTQAIISEQALLRPRSSSNRHRGMQFVAELVSNPGCLCLGGWRGSFWPGRAKAISTNWALLPLYRSASLNRNRAASLWNTLLSSLQLAVPSQKAAHLHSVDMIIHVWGGGSEEVYLFLSDDQGWVVSSEF